MHCAAHKLSLAASQAGDGVPYVKKFKDILRKLHDFFDNSSVRTVGLGAVQELLNDLKLKLLQPSLTRWLSVVISLGREAEECHDVTAAGLHHIVTEYKFVATMLLLSDVLPTVNRLSLLFQAEWIDFTSVSKYVQSTVSKLEGMKTKDGNSLKAIGDYVQQLSQSGVELRSQVQRGEIISDRHEIFRRSVQSLFLNQLITNINSRFKDTDVIFSFLSVFDPRNLANQDKSQDEPVTPCDDDDDDDGDDHDHADTAKTPATTAKSLQDYGDDIIRTMCSRFGIDMEPALEEWGDFKQFSSDHQKKLKLRDVTHQLCTNETQRHINCVPMKLRDSFTHTCRNWPKFAALLHHTQWTVNEIFLS